MAKQRFNRYTVRLMADHPDYSRPTRFDIRAQSKPEAVAIVVGDRASKAISWSLISVKNTKKRIKQ